MRTPTLFFVALFAFGAQAADTAPLAVGKKAKVFRTDDGVDMTVALLEPAGSKRALVRFTGTTSAHEGKVFLVEINEWGENVDYKTNAFGKDPYVIVTVRGGQYEAYLPDVKRSLRVRYDDKKSEAARPEELLKDFKAQAAK